MPPSRWSRSPVCCSDSRARTHGVGNAQPARTRQGNAGRTSVWIPNCVACGQRIKQTAWQQGTWRQPFPAATGRGMSSTRVLLADQRAKSVSSPCVSLQSRLPSFERPHENMRKGETVARFCSLLSTIVSIFLADAA